MRKGRADRRRITVLAGGVGAAKFLRGLVRAVPPSLVSVIVNTADDHSFFGLHVSPDLDTVVYTLAGVSHPAHGWGRAADSFNCLQELRRFYGRPWFALGDRDLATHIFRTERLAAGKSLTSVTGDLARSFGIKAQVLPMTDQPVRTVLRTSRGILAFQDYFVRCRARPAIKTISLRGARQARPAPGVVDSILKAALVILAPSNPLVSIWPILSIPGIKAALTRTPATVVAISPIVGGKAVTGPAARMMRAVSRGSSSADVAKLYRSFLDLMVVDRHDRRAAREIRALGIGTLEESIIIPTAARAQALARRLLAHLSPAAML